MHICVYISVLLTLLMTPRTIISVSSEPMEFSRMSLSTCLESAHRAAGLCAL